MKWCLLDFNKITSQTEMQEKWTSILLNTGNLVFMHSLKKILDVQPLTPEEADKGMDNFDGIVTTSLIYIREEDTLESFEPLLKRYNDKPIVPISVGLQAPNLDYKFRINDHAVKILQEIAERAVLGIRGEYSAEILNSHGIKNIQVIGCPSVYYNLDNFFIKKRKIEEIKVASSIYSTTGGFFYKNKYETDFLNYIVKNNFTLIKQTRSDDRHVEKFNLRFSDEVLFFNAEEWMSFVKKFDFSFGARFHGNVMSVISGVPALFITVDSRTEEMCRYFKFPAMCIKNFSPDKTPDEYYELADYTDFNLIYPIRLQNFRTFCNKNNIKLRDNISS